MANRTKLSEASQNRSAAVKPAAPEAAISAAAAGEIARVVKDTQGTAKTIKMKENERKAKAHVKGMAHQGDRPKANPGKQARQKEARLDVTEVIDLEETETTGQIYFRLLGGDRVVLAAAGETVLEDLIEACSAALSADRTDDYEEEDDTEDEDADDE